MPADGPGTGGRRVSSPRASESGEGALRAAWRLFRDLQEFASNLEESAETAVVPALVSDSEGRTFILVPPPRAAEEGSGPVETGSADVVTLQRRCHARMSAHDEESFFVDALTNYQWARDSAGLASSTIDQLIKPVIEVCDYFGTVP